MFNWLQSLFRVPVPVGPPAPLRSFTGAEKTISRSDITAEAGSGGWRFSPKSAQTFRLFEVPAPGLEQCMITYRAEMKSEDLEGRGYLELWCRIPGRGEFFSKGLARPVRGSTGWASYEVPFYLKTGQRADMLKLNLTVEGAGIIWMKNIELLRTSLR